jgi:hypothetical protein
MVDKIITQATYQEFCLTCRPQLLVGRLRKTIIIVVPRLVLAVIERVAQPIESPGRIYSPQTHALHQVSLNQSKCP